MDLGYRINVLWIDDDPSDSFQDAAYEEQIDITVAKFVIAAKKMLEDRTKKWDAIILDANCKIYSENEAPNIDALAEAIDLVGPYQDKIPWFVYTGGTYEGISSLKHIIKSSRQWDDRKYYHKGTDMDALFDNIKKAVSMSPISHIRAKYSSITSICPRWDLVEILNHFENDENFDYDKDVPKRVRDILNWLFRELNSIQFLLVKFNNCSQNAANDFLGRESLSEFIDIHHQKALDFCVYYANNGSHDGLPVNTDITEGKSRFLNKLGVFALLDVLSWYNNLRCHYSETDFLAVIPPIAFPDGVWPVYKDKVTNVYYVEISDNTRIQLKSDKNIEGKIAGLRSKSINTNSTINTLFQYFTSDYSILF